MPIKAENKHRYPADWPDVRERILKRANYRCEHVDQFGRRCGARQYSVGWWSALMAGCWEWRPGWGQNDNPRTYQDARAVAAGMFHAQGECDEKPIVIVLTVAHLDHVPEHCDDTNLQAMCQRHHLAHDHQHHMANAQATRRARSGNLELFA